MFIEQGNQSKPNKTKKISGSYRIYNSVIYHNELFVVIWKEKIAKV